MLFDVTGSVLNECLQPKIETSKIQLNQMPLNKCEIITIKEMREEKWTYMDGVLENITSSNNKEKTKKTF